MEFSDTLFFFGSVKSTDVDPLLWLCLAVVVVVGALQLSAGELIGLVDVVLVGDSPVSLLLLLSVVPAKNGRPNFNSVHALSVTTWTLNKST